jgi:hypothetical protein
MDYWRAVKAACYWYHERGAAAYVVEWPDGFGVVLDDDLGSALHSPDVRVCLRVGR